MCEITWVVEVDERVDVAPIGRDIICSQATNAIQESVFSLKQGEIPISAG